MQRFLFARNFFDRNANNSTNRAHSNSNFSTLYTITQAKPAGNILIPAWLSYLNFLILFIVYPGISNPGPKSHIKVPLNNNKSISVFYQNVQGLIPFGCLTDLHYNLDNTKIYELQAYILKNNPYVIILNETWLKPSILNTEILPSDYNVFRLDRSIQSHPIDPINPNKFRRNGGGVLIAVNSKLSLQSKVVPIKCAAQLPAIELTLPDSTKIIISTCYRIGALGMANCNEIMQALNKLSRKKMLRKFLVIGDFNLKCVNWNMGNSTNTVENEFVNGFADLGLMQCIDAPTHNKGKTLDVLYITYQI